MPAISEAEIRAQIGSLREPNLDLSFADAGIIREMVVIGDTVKLTVKLNYLWPQAEKILKSLVTQQLADIGPGLILDLSVHQSIARHVAANGQKSLPNIKNIIAVASGKGGVGKSTVAVNLALALQLQGARVGLLDADIYGPSQAHMLGVNSKPIIKQDKSIQPIIAHGLQTMSIAYLINADTPAVWRGPMVSGALQQMLTSTCWDNLDYLIIDLPPGTGDIQLTLAQKIPVCGAVIVSTPQDIALLDVKKAMGMFTRVKVPILGVVENMSMHTCSNCGQQEHIFGAQGAQLLALQHGFRMLGSLPLDRKIREQSDSGVPIVLEQNSAIASEYVSIATKAAAELSKAPRNLSIPLQNIVIEEA